MYKEFRVIAERINGTQLIDYFMANSNQEAVYCFNQCYRNGVYKILSVEVIE